MGFAGRAEHRLDIADGEILHGLHSRQVAILAANNLHHSRAARECQILFVAQRLD